MDGEPDIGDGARIAALRVSRHLTQRALAERAVVSHSLLTKVESGSRPASDALVAACARAMGVDPAVLTGRPHRGDPDTLSPTGRWVFLECNPGGQYGWLEARTGAPLTAALADLLTGTAS